MAIGRIEINEQLLLSNGATQVAEQRLKKNKTLKKCYQETIETDDYAGCVGKVDQTELNWTRYKMQMLFATSSPQ